MTLKRLFFLAMGIAAGVIFGIGVLLGAYLWWNSRARSPDTTSIVATYDGTFSRIRDEDRIVGLRYALENRTDRDIRVEGHALTVHVRRTKDGSLIDLQELRKGDPVPDIQIPARERVLWLLNLEVPYAKTYMCKDMNFFMEDPTREELQKFIETCWSLINGFRVQSDNESRLLFELPTPRISTSEKKP